MWLYTDTETYLKKWEAIISKVSKLVFLPGVVFHFSRTHKNGKDDIFVFTLKEGLVYRIIGVRKFTRGRIPVRRMMGYWKTQEKDFLAWINIMQKIASSGQADSLSLSSRIWYHLPKYITIDRDTGNLKPRKWRHILSVLAPAEEIQFVRSVRNPFQELLALRKFRAAFYNTVIMHWTKMLSKLPHLPGTLNIDNISENLKGVMKTVDQKISAIQAEISKMEGEEDDEEDDGEEEVNLPPMSAMPTIREIGGAEFPGLHIRRTRVDIFKPQQPEIQEGAGNVFSIDEQQVRLPPERVGNTPAITLDVPGLQDNEDNSPRESELPPCGRTPEQNEQINLGVTNPGTMESQTSERESSIFPSPASLPRFDVSERGNPLGKSEPDSSDQSQNQHSEKV